MNPQATPGRLFRNAVAAEKPLQLAGVINAYAAVMAERAGFNAIYLSGSGVATASYGLPDLGITSLEDVLVDVRRITSVSRLPLLVDADTGFGPAFVIARTVREMSRAGAAGIHIEDQAQAKRCGHRPGKQLVPSQEMADRIKAAVDAKPDPDFVVMARTDALAVEGLQAALDRVAAYREAGADMVFAEAVTKLDDYPKFKAAARAPVLANITEFGKTPMFTKDELRDAGVDIILYPLSAFRAMNAAAMRTYSAIRSDGTQKSVIKDMQTREELYDLIRYHDYEQKLDKLFGKQQ
ncbi:MAG: methylisocitrate lyase [Dehalococcoidia bacterium]|nr:methylisocitrate lyase [Dehalococcoidia bacterium]MSQ34852.1 methylisocitrate lyase [Dehalococcoidia bacterium]